MDDGSIENSITSVRNRKRLEADFIDITKLKQAAAQDNSEAAKEYKKYNIMKETALKYTEKANNETQKSNEYENKMQHETNPAKIANLRKKSLKCQSNAAKLNSKAAECSYQSKGFLEESLIHKQQANSFEERAEKIRRGDIYNSNNSMNSQLIRDVSNDIAKPISQKPTNRIVSNYQQTHESFNQIEKLDETHQQHNFNKETDVTSDNDNLKTKANEMIERYARVILRLEYERNRPISREEAFRDGGVPYANLEAVFTFLSQIDEFPLESMNPREKDEMERSSREVLVRIMGTGTPAQKIRIRLADISVNFPNYPLWKAKRVLGYIQSVDRMAFPPEPNPEMDALLHKALRLPPEKRTVIGLVESLGLGVMKAKQLQALLATFRKPGYIAPVKEIGTLVSEEYDGSNATPKSQLKSQSWESPQQRQEPENVNPGLARKYCTAHGHMAVMRHSCGAYLCHNCVSGTSTCPACRQPIHGGQNNESPRRTEHQGEFDEQERKHIEEQKKRQIEEEERISRAKEIEKLLSKVVSITVPEYMDAGTLAEILVELHNTSTTTLTDISLDTSQLEEDFEVTGTVAVKTLSPGKALEQRIKIKPRYEKGTFPVKITIVAKGARVVREYSIKVGGTEIY
jgi:hypothetical protein